MSFTDQDALDYHSEGRPGKLKIVPTKPMATQRDLSLAYSPGVAIPVLEIAKHPETAYDYTAKGNLVAVISNGTAILGLGNLGPLASKPVMEGKAVLFKRFADIDVFDIEVNSLIPDEIIRTSELIAPTFGGINLEDIKAPECFYIERELQSRLEIPVFHDDQHGTAIISGAGLINALEIINKQNQDIRIVINGAGAAGIACADFYVALGARHESIMLCDSKGVVYKGRTAGMNEYKEKYAVETDARSLADALVGADAFMGLSAANCVSQEMVRSMAANPIIFAMANPDPEITYPLAMSAREDTVIMGTGRSDYPNQVNNVLGFPFIFRGALDVRARAINMEMKLAAAKALAALTKEDVSDAVIKAYGVESMEFGPDYIIPKPLDPRVLMWVAPAVAQAAMDTGVARIQLDMSAYMDQLAGRLGKGTQIMRLMQHKAESNPKRVVFGEGEQPKVIRAAHALQSQGIAKPILLGRPEKIAQAIAEMKLAYEPTVVDPNDLERRRTYAKAFTEQRKRKGMNLDVALDMLRQSSYFGPMMVEMGEGDAFISGLTQNYPAVLRPAMQVVGTQKGRGLVSGVHVIIAHDQIFFFTDPTVNIEPSVDDLATIAINAADVAKQFDVAPRIAMLSFSTFGSTRHPLSEKVRLATEKVKALRPDLMVDGEMQADVAVVADMVTGHYPFSQVKNANVLVFPDLTSANTSYKLMARLGDAESIGPILVGMGKPVHVLERGCEVRDIVNVAILAVVDVQYRESQIKQGA